MGTRSDPRKKRITKSDSAVKVLRRFRAVFNAVRSHFRTVEKRAGVSGAQVWALSQVAANPGMGVGQLARAMDIHQSTASNLVRDLLQGGLVVSERGDADRRAVHLHATARGLKVLAKAPTPFTGVLPAALGQLDGPTLERLDQDLEKLLRVLRADGKGESTPLWSDDR
jgi:DNA-binding MarR family transcriptional regulator